MRSDVPLLIAASFPILAILPATASGAAGGLGPIVVTSQQIEADWLRQDELRSLPPRPSFSGYRTTQQTAFLVPQGTGALCEEDAAGAVDGVKRSGGWGFCTGKDDKPWWQVDLGREMPLDWVLIYNTDTPANVNLCRDLMLLVSGDGKSWNAVYRHDGRIFAGPNQPLTIPLKGAKARHVRVQLPRTEYLILDEVEVYAAGSGRNVALGRPANQSSTSPWSKRRTTAVARPVARSPRYPADKVVASGLRLAENLRGLGLDVREPKASIDAVAAALKQLPRNAPAESRRDLYFRARWTVRRLTLANPLLDFKDLVFVKRVPTSYSTNCDQYLGWWSRPGGGLYVLKDFKSETPHLVCLTSGLPPGNVVRPELSYDGTKVLFAYCRHYPGLSADNNKLDRSHLAEDAFYKLYEVRLDGSGLRRLTHGKYDDFDGRYLPDGQIVFLSTRRGQHVQCSKASASATLAADLPDCFVRCGGGPDRPCSVHTLHIMDGDGGNLRPLSSFEMYEYTPSVDHDGRILYARWDYVDRFRVPCISLWSTLPDGSNAQEIFGNYLPRNPHCIFEARAIPGSRKLIFTASAHHSITGGSLVLLDAARGRDAESAMTRLTPEIPFPESEGWAETYFANPWPLSEEHYLVAWSDRPLVSQPEGANPSNAVGLYLFDTFGNLNLIYRDPEIGSQNPIPVRPRPRPPQYGGQTVWDGPQEGRMLLSNVYAGLDGVSHGSVRRLRIVGIPTKTHPTMNYPVMGVTADDPGKFVIGTAPVERDGSAYFRVPSGVPFFVQALDADGLAVQTMRSATYVQPGQTFACIGCHESRVTAPPVRPSATVAAGREPSKLAPGPDGSWPLDYNLLVQPVLDKHCRECHAPGGKDADHDLTAGKSYDTLINYGKPSLRQLVLQRYEHVTPSFGPCAAQSSPLVKLLKRGHYAVHLREDDWDRLVTWIDTYGQRRGAFSPTQENDLRELRRRLASLLGH